MADTYNLNIDAGATFSLSITWKDANNNAVDITNYTARMQIRKTYNSDTAMVNLTTENGGISLTNAANGVLSVNITPAQTAALSNGFYDLEIESPTGVVSRLIQGSVMVSKEVTR